METIRVEAAKLMLEESRLPLEEIAQAVGFANRERMRRSFLRVYGEVPRAIRQAAGRSPSCEADPARGRCAGRVRKRGLYGVGGGHGPA